MNKDQFIRRQETQIAMNFRLLEASKACHAVIPKFDGKVFNIRLTKALDEYNSLEGIVYSILNNKISVHSFISRSYPDYPNNIGEYSTHSYITTDQVLFKVILKDNRVDAKATMKIVRKAEADLADKIKELRFCIDNYDQHAKESKDLKQRIIEYKKRWPAEIQDYITINKR